MKKLLLIITLMLCVVSASYASNARLAGMGVANWMTDDASNMWFSPAYVSDYTGRIYGELGDLGAGVAANQWGGATAKFWLGNAGVFFARPYVNNAAVIGANAANSLLTAIPTTLAVPVVGSAATFPAVANMSAAAPTNKIDLLYGFDIAKTIKLGIDLNFADAVYNYSDIFATTAGKITGDGSITYNRATYEVNASAGLTISQLGPIPQLDIYGGYGMPIVNNYLLEQAYLSSKNADKTDEKSLTSDGAYNLTLGARAKLMINNMKVFVNGNWNQQNLSSIYKQRQDSNADGVMETDFLQNRKTTMNTINAGIVLNNQVNEKTLVIAGVGARIMTYEMTGFETNVGVAKIESAASGMQFSVPVNLAVEHQLPWWGLIGRAGLVYTLAAQSQSTGSPTFNGADQYVNTDGNQIAQDITGALVASLGLSKEFTETLSCDLVIRQGAATGLLNSVTTQMSLVYKF